MKASFVLGPLRLLVLAGLSISACGRSDIDGFFDEVPAGDDDGIGPDDPDDPGRGGANARGGSSMGRGGAPRGGAPAGGTGTGAVAGIPANGGTSVAGASVGGAASAGAPSGGVGGVGAAAGSGAPGGAQGTAGTPATGGSPAAGSGGQPSGLIRCGELACEPRVSVCCRAFGQFECTATLDDCPRLGLACSGGSTCEPGLVCCLRNRRATCETSCEPGDPGPGRGFRLCDSSAECEANQTCISGPRGLTWCADNFP